MKSKDFQFTTKKRRGLSSVVGALIFVVLMVATFAVLGVALDSQTLIVDTSRTVADTGLKKQQENFIVTSALQPPLEPLQIKATNLGQNSAEIFTLIITNSSDITNGYPVKTYEIPSDTSFLPPSPDIETDIVNTLNLTLAITPDGIPETYDLKMISSLGTIKRLQIVCNNTFCGASGGTGTGDIVAQMFLDGPTGVNTKTTTVIMFVTNTGELPLTGVAPDLGNPTPDCDDMWQPGPAGADVSPCDLDALSPVDLAPSQTWMFKWDGQISGAVDDVFLFCNSATGTLPDFTTVNTGLECDDLTVIDPNDCGGCDEGGEAADNVVIIDDLLIRPSIFLTIPSPFGISDDKNDVGVWGVNVANPTNSTMSISKVTITAFAPGANDNNKIFDETSTANHTNVSPPGPGLLGSWFVGETGQTNVAVWKNFTNPIILSHMRV